MAGKADALAKKTADKTNTLNPKAGTTAAGGKNRKKTQSSRKEEFEGGDIYY
jgi:hypothetical protein